MQLSTGVPAGDVACRTVLDVSVECQVDALPLLWSGFTHISAGCYVVHGRVFLNGLLADLQGQLSMEWNGA